jgi:hypothetical protein
MPWKIWILFNNVILICYTFCSIIVKYLRIPNRNEKLQRVYI